MIRKHTKFFGKNMVTKALFLMGGASLLLYPIAPVLAQADTSLATPETETVVEREETPASPPVTSDSPDVLLGIPGANLSIPESESVPESISDLQNETENLTIVDTTPINTQESTTTPPVPKDKEPSQFKTVAPQPGTTIAGVIELRAIKKEQLELVSLQFKVNGKDVGQAIQAPPYKVKWDSREVPNGEYNVAAIGKDTQGKNVKTEPVKITILNRDQNSPTEETVATSTPPLELSAATSTTPLLEKTLSATSTLEALLVPRIDPIGFSHAPLRALPTASDRSLTSGPSYYVSSSGNDTTGDGSIDKPWKTIHFALGNMSSGDTLYLRSGIYHQDRSLNINVPNITVRSYKDELAIVDFSYPEFYNDPANSWMPCSRSPDSTGCVSGEYVSTQKYMQSEAGIYGNFGDSMVPLFRYPNLTHLRAQTQTRADDSSIYYTGPGAVLDQTGDHRIHIRLSHTTLGTRVGYNYQGETDPRNISLILTHQGSDEDFKVQESNVTLQDFVIRGHRDLSLTGSGVELDGMYVYNAAGTLAIMGDNVRILHSKIRGVTAPWTSRYVLKNPGGNLQLMVIGSFFFDGSNGINTEIAYSELTDAQDGIEWGYAAIDWSLHHNIIENFVDDVMNPKGMSETGKKLFYQNYVSGVRQVFGFDGGGLSVDGIPPEDTNEGLYVYRNIFDLRRFTYGGAPLSGDEGEIIGDGWHTSKLTGDHMGGIIRPGWRFYHNAIASWRGLEGQQWYMMGLGKNLNKTRRWVYNNVEIQIERNPYNQIAPGTGDFHASGNIHYSVQGASAGGYPAGDLYVDPKFVSFPLTYGDPLEIQDANFRLQTGSPAINAGVQIPSDWPDPLRGCDDGAPDIGPIPLNVTRSTIQNISSCSSPPPSKDTAAPTISISAPSAGSSLSGIVTLAARASDDREIAGVQFKVNGTNVGGEDTTFPYSTSWNTSGIISGTYTISAVARDAAGNTKTSSSVSVRVSSKPPVGPPPSEGGSSGGGGGGSSDDDNDTESPLPAPTQTTILPVRIVPGTSSGAPADISPSSRVQTSSSLFVRSSPSPNAPTLALVGLGTQGTIMSDPVTADGYTWVQVQYDSGVTGWSALNWLFSVNTAFVPTTPSTPPPSGDRVYTTASLSVRSAPNTGATLLGVVPAGTGGTVIEGPTITLGYPWLKVQYDNGVTGWSSQTWLSDE